MVSPPATPGVREHSGPGASPAKKISQEDLEKAVERLTRSATPSRPLEPIPQFREPPKMTQAELEQSVARMCDGAMEAKHRNAIALEQRILADRRPHSVMSSEEVELSISRLYTGSVKTAQAKLAALRQQYLHKRIEAPRDKTMVDHSIQHLFYEENERRLAMRKRLLEKYVAHTGPKAVKIDPGTVSKVVERLTGAK